MSPSFWNSKQRETALHRALLEALFRLGDQAAPEGRWRLRSLIEELQTRPPGAWIHQELQAIRPWLRASPVESSRDAADAVEALIGALECSSRPEPSLAAAIRDLSLPIGPKLDPKTARSVARRARDLQRFARRNQELSAARVRAQATHAQHLRESLTRLITRLATMQTPARAMILGDLHQAQRELAMLEGVLERPEAPHTHGSTEPDALGDTTLLAMVG